MFFTEFGEDGEEWDADEVAYHGEGVEEAEGAGIDAGVGVGGQRTQQDGVDAVIGGHQEHQQGEGGTLAEDDKHKWE